MLFCLSSTFFIYFSVSDKRREWDSNPRALADKRFSRPPRYDHFDISPYIKSIINPFCTPRVVLHSRGCLCQCKTYSTIKIFMCQQYFLFFSKIRSILQKSLCHSQIFRSCNLNILVRTLYQQNPGSSLLFHYHCIICHITHILLLYALISCTD